MGKDINQLAQFMQEQAARQAISSFTPPPGKNVAAVALGKLTGLKGGKVSAEKLTARKRSEIAQKATQTRWSKKP